MPSATYRQMRYLEHKFGHAWVKKHHFDKVKKDDRKKKEDKR